MSDELGQRKGSTSRPQDSRRRERASSTRQFLFIDSNTDRNTIGEAVRVHVMRESHRNRRERQGSRNQQRRNAVQDEMVILNSTNTGSQASITPPTTTRPDEQTETPILNASIDWVELVRNGVSQFSLGSAQELYSLAEGYLRSVRLVQPDVLHLCRDDQLSLSAYLALAAWQFASDEEEHANITSVQFEARALELLRLRIRDAARMHTDTTIIAVLLLAQLEQHKASLESALFHRNALQRLIEDRGGLEVLQEQNNELFNVLADGGYAGAVK